MSNQESPFFMDKLLQLAEECQKQAEITVKFMLSTNKTILLILIWLSALTVYVVLG